LIREIIAQGRKPEGGFTDYLWSNTANEAPRLKRSYSREFKPWGWVVGTGNYVDDIEAVIGANEARLHDTLRNSAVEYGITAMIIALFALWLAKTFITKEMEKIGGDPERDHLTGSLSRMKLLNIARERRAKLIAQHKTLSVAMLDVDHFKQINDSYGHPVGDLALRHIATICGEVLRAFDYFGRYGGEEFLFIFPNADESVSLRIAERLRAIIENSPLVLDDGRKLFITVSLGVATLRPETDGMHDTIENLIDCADKALYRAKEEGRNRTRSADIQPECA
jgi:diguanylate cyclase (GGDEF)-like protein